MALQTTQGARLGDVIARILPEITALRHELHQHPEIRFQEVWTSDRVARFLDGIDIPYRRGYAKGTGIVAEIAGLRGGGGRTVALRADMDALEVEEATGLPYASLNPGRMHACGHDGHTATLCGAAKALRACRDQFAGTVRLVFQPGEEVAAGGRLIVEEGALDGVSAVFGLHGWPTLPLGSVASRPGCMMAGARDFLIRIHGAGAHGADPASGVDPVVAAAHTILALQTIVSRETDPRDSRVVTATILRAGQATNIIPDTAELSGTMRSLEPEGLDALVEAVRRIAEHTALAFRARAETDFGESAYPPLYNDAEMTALIAETADDLLGPGTYRELDAPVMASEDFAYYLQRAPGAFFYVGVNPHPERPYPNLHSSRYNFSDEALPIAIGMMANAALRYLASA